MVPEQSSPPLIRLKGISKSFGQTQANADISLDIRAGRIKALLGENGAGKSTLMSILAGRFQPDRGDVQVRGRTTVFNSPKQAIEAGIGMVYQHFMLVEGMTVAENVVLGQEGRFWLKPKRIFQEVGRLAERYKLEVDPGARVSSLSMGEKQRVEILKLLFRESSILILDEPTTVLTPTEIEQLFQAMRHMSDSGKAIVFISHKLDEVMSVADEVAILRQGHIVDEMEISQVTSTRELALRMVGREIFLHPDKKPISTGRDVLRLQNVWHGPLQDISLRVKSGEINAVVGVAGNGQKPLVEIISGQTPPKQGLITILDKPWKDFYRSSKWLEDFCYIPEDRLGLATCPALDLGDNFLLTTREHFSRGPWLDKKKARAAASDLFKTFNVRFTSLKAKAGELSGGNLQKLVLARELYRRPKLILAEQPSQGLDIAATEEIWNYLLQARGKAGILLITSDLNEALSLADWITVIYRGRIMDTFPAADQEKVSSIGPLMAGLKD
ncbi:MAG: ABC transporter ATP-binding protein [Desulfohalobiaceae bacterium]|nr:ABC transporter ATP-binding protein [Desulfohalobiaceae bacterium]